jgi:ATP-binding cassette, subfamily B, bacterial PglK
MLRKLLILLDRGQRHRLLLIVVGTFLAGLLEMVGIGAIPGFVGLLIEPGRLIDTLPESVLTNWIRQIDVATLVLYGAGILAGVFIVKNLYLAALTYAEARLGADVTASASKRLFRAYLYSPYTFHLQRNPAELLRNLIDESIHCMEFVKGGVRLLREGLVLAVVFVLLMFFDPLVSLSVFLLLAFASGGFYLSVRRALTARGELSQEHWNHQVKIVNQTLGAIKDIKMLGRDEHMMKLFNLEVECSQRHDTFYLVVSALPKLFLEVLSVIALVLVAGLFVLAGRPVQAMLPVLALLGVVVARLVPAAITINVSLADIRYKRPAFDLVCAELEHFDAPDPSLAHPVRKVVTESAPHKMQRGIRVKNIHYRYSGALVDALQEVSIEISAGEAVAFIGQSGAGKSTLIDIILGLLTPNSGQIFVDGSDIHQDLSAWQRQIGYIPQSIYLIDDSIRRNIAFGLNDDEINEVALARALQAAQLESFVHNLPEGLDTVIGNRGIRLSGGQRQRISIARALYHDPTVLVMDEATNALDNETEREVIDAIDRLRRGRTIIMVAHRMTTVRSCDRLYLLQEGRVKDQGSYSELATRHRNLRPPPMRFATL